MDSSKTVRSDRSRLLFAVAVVLVVFTLIVVIGWFSLSRLRRTLNSEITTPQEQTVTVGEIVTKVRALNRLETASMEVMHVSTTKQSYKYLPDAVAGDEVTFLAVGQVVAGVDMSRMTDRDVRIVGRRIYVDLPPAEVLITKIDNGKSQVMKRDTGMLRKSDPQLESRIRLRVEGEIRNEAVRKGVLELAQNNASARIAELLHRAGYDDVVVSRSSAPQPKG